MTARIAQNVACRSKVGFSSTDVRDSCFVARRRGTSGRAAEGATAGGGGAGGHRGSCSGAGRERLGRTHGCYLRAARASTFPCRPRHSPAPSVPLPASPSASGLPPALQPRLLLLPRMTFLPSQGNWQVHPAHEPPVALSALGRAVLQTWPDLASQPARAGHSHPCGSRVAVFRGPLPSRAPRSRRLRGALAGPRAAELGAGGTLLSSAGAQVPPSCGAWTSQSFYIFEPPQGAT